MKIIFNNDISNLQTLNSVNSSIAKIGDTLKTIRETTGAMDNFKNGKFYEQEIPIKKKKNGTKLSKRLQIILLQKSDQFI